MTRLGGAPCPTKLRAEARRAQMLPHTYGRHVGGECPERGVADSIGAA
jgi:hypothetical protein